MLFSSLIFKTPTKTNFKKKGLGQQISDHVETNVADPRHVGVDPDPDWIRGSMPLTNGSGFGSGSCYILVIDLQDANKKLI